VVSRYNDFVTDRLQAAALAALQTAQVPEESITLVRVPGAFELPSAARLAAETGQFDAIVCLGCLIRGATPHFEYVAGECARGLMDAGLATGVPVIFGVLTTATISQAEERASLNRMNKGGESMEAALEMIELLTPFSAPRPKAAGRAATQRAAKKRGGRG
jgi:6,7-dimethyl-8-ribityllumazine synthase